MGWRGHTPKTFATTRAPAVLKSRNTYWIPDRNTTDGLFGLLLTGGYWWTWAEVQKFPNLLPAVSHTHTLLSSHLWRYHFHLLGNAFEIKRTKIRNQFHETMISSKTESCFAWKYFLYFLRCSSCFIARILSCQAHWDLFCQDESQTTSGELVKANWPSLMKMFCRDVMPTPIAQPQDVRVVVNVYY